MQSLSINVNRARRIAAKFNTEIAEGNADELVLTINDETNVYWSITGGAQQDV